MGNNKYLTREEFFKFLEEDKRKWEENQRKWEENQKVIQSMVKSFQRSLSKMGARFGFRLEAFSRELIRAFLDQNGIKKDRVRRLNIYDQEGKVFGYPENIEIDVFIQEPLVAGEITSFIEEKDKLYNFQKKVELLEDRYNKKARLKFVACLDMEPRIKKDIYSIARKFGIKILMEE